MGFSEKGILVRLGFLYERCGRLELTMIVAHLEESLLVIRGLGIQTSTSSNTYLSKATTRFIPTTQIQDIVIHEAFKGFEVRFYLAVIVEGEPNVVVVFPVGLPNWLQRARPASYDLSRISYRNGPSWKRFGGVLDIVCMTRNDTHARCAGF